MELFFPSILILVLAAGIIFVIMPKLSPYVLGIVALILLVVGVYQHYTMFPYEYQTSMISAMLQQYSGLILIGAMIFGLLVLMMWTFGLSPPSVANILPAMPEMPAMPAIPGINAPLNRPANNKGILGLGGSNNTKRNNLASTSFKSV
jgi:hypothetical protein